MTPVNVRNYTSAVLAAALFMTFTTSALADVPPPDECPNTQSAGQACTTAGPHFNEDGTCVATTCTGAGRPGVPERTFACLICMLPDAATPVPPNSDADVATESSVPATNDAAAPAVDATQTIEAGEPTTKDSSVESTTTGTPPAQELESSGCSMTPVGGLGARAGWPLAFLGGLALFASARRRRWS